MLKKRLAQLRRETGAASPPPAPPDSPSLAERLRRHGRQPGSVRAKPRDDEQLAGELGAKRVAPGLLCVDTRFPLSGRHGEVALAGLTARPEQLPLPVDAEAGFGAGFDAGRLLFFDTETTGLSGGVGTLAFMIGLARIEGQDLVLRQLMLTTLAAEASMLEMAAGWCGAATTGVSYNGLSFDLPLLAGRCRLTGVVDRFSVAPQIDLLHPVRRAFATVWPECRLATVERRLLRFRRRDDLPGAEAPAAWLAWLQRGDAGRLAAVLRHNLWDLLSLAALLPTLNAVYRDPLRYGADVGAIARGHLKRGRPERALALLQRDADGLGPRDRHDLARLYRNQGRWQQACAIWRPLAGQGDAIALESLAKFHEHRRGDYQRALACAQRLPTSVERDKRCRRLQRRLSAHSANND